MCTLGAEYHAAAVAAFMAEFPHLVDAPAEEHPALAGCEDVAWADLHGCHAHVPVLLRGLLEADAAPEAERCLVNLAFASPFAVGEVMAPLLPFWLRVVADADAPARVRLAGALAFAAESVRDDDNAVPWDSTEQQKRDGAACRGAFAAEAEWVRRLLDDAALCAEAGLTLEDVAALSAVAA
ncbi:hypothetical protein OG216_05460 [Streptomycetaceae bacterium NBC_01309]